MPKLAMPQGQPCPVCESPETILFLERENVPVHQNFPLPDKQTAKAITKGSLHLSVCKSCGFVFNQAFDETKLSYGENYDNTQDYSSVFKAHTDQLKHYLLETKGVRNCRIVEVGCGRGAFIKDLISNKDYGNRGIGFDPSYIGEDELFDGRLQFRRQFYGPESADIPADVVICRHVIEHVTSPVNLLTAVRKAISNSPNARIFFETPCLEWILNNKVIWDFFYEHCSYLSTNSLRTAFEKAGFYVNSVEHVFCGQYLWIEATVNSETGKVKTDPAHLPTLAQHYATSETGLIASWRETIHRLKQQGKVALWGAGAKGVTFANMLDPTCDLLDCIVDLNPKKHNRFIPGSGHIIVNYQQLNERSVKTAILMNPNYRLENEELLKKAELEVELII